MFKGEHGLKSKQFYNPKVYVMIPSINSHNVGEISTEMMQNLYNPKEIIQLRNKWPFCIL